MFDKTIYVIREPRCGGTFLSSYITNKISERWKVHLSPETPELFCDTHDFGILDREVIHNSKAFVIRIDRRNLTEHMLSMKAAESVRYQFTNLLPEESSNPLWTRIQNSVIPIELSDVRIYIENKINIELKVLDTITKHNIPYVKIWYEDSFEDTFDIPMLDLYGLCPSKEKNTVATLKLPAYKHNVFPNYNEVSSWMKRIKDIYIEQNNLSESLGTWITDTVC